MLIGFDEQKISELNIRGHYYKKEIWILVAKQGKDEDLDILVHDLSADVRAIETSLSEKR